jgi:hypothetical protein
VGAAYRKGITEGIASTPVEWTDQSRTAARQQLTRILESHHFHSSKRCSQFLRYVVEHTIDNHHEPLKERTLGIEIFGRDAMYDTALDPVVRTTAGEVRKRLAQYYIESGQHELRISLPAGTYVPEIHSPNAVLAPEVVPPPAEIPSHAPSLAQELPRRKMGWWAFTFGTLTLAALAIFLTMLLRPTDLDRFWGPFVEAEGPVIVCLGQPHSYFFNQKVQATLNRWFENRSATGGPLPEMKSVPLEEIVPVWDRQISLSDARAFSQICGLLARKGQKVELRVVRETSLANLRGKPCVLVGAFNNEWNVGLTGELRFYFERDANQADSVRDRRNPGKSDWKVLNAWPYPLPASPVTQSGQPTQPPTDYAIVSRVVNPITEQTVVTIAGLTGFGTQAAGEFLTNEAYLAEALKQAPRNWQKKNMQVVLSTRVMSGTPGPPQVLAVHFW